ncbi:helix-turn-helix domain-containing protein [Empedobacter falsenii]|uniref:Helix-turn-helix domain-containing protein n=1 Tax=Empedobacter falsenii TaxID=343874 RepID=A0A7H9DRM4_9FLAO|nr:helix-turn-helix domain-containing protein [Empedobacter falsenii]MDM1063938.1 helix-turn-helix domain-containing protein [Empedobacter falsenii]MDM1549384.1 helix-turn-helix domain-containing protein [Empedobacter falsenii]QLL57828.1 helix-turn-helix domain-containing protein [Empedobacter falsenii]
MSSPNYKLIFEDILSDLYPEKKDLCTKILSKDNLNIFDILTLNKLIFGNSLNNRNNKFKTYSEEEILYILKFKKNNKLKNIEIAEHFNLSRNTITKWLKKYNDNY